MINIIDFLNQAVKTLPVTASTLEAVKLAIADPLEENCVAAQEAIRTDRSPKYIYGTAGGKRNLASSALTYLRGGVKEVHSSLLSIGTSEKACWDIIR